MKYGFWLLVSPQFLYDPEVLETVAARAKEMATVLYRGLIHSFIHKVTAKISQEIIATVVTNPACAVSALSLW